MNKKFISILLCILMLISSFAISTFAEEPEINDGISQEESTNIGSDESVQSLSDSSSNEKEKLSWETFKQDMYVLKNDAAAIPFFGILGAFACGMFIITLPLNIFSIIIGLFN